MGEMTGTAFDGGVAQASDFWKDNGDRTYTVQLQCVYKNDLRFVNLRVFEEAGVVKATQIDQNWCSGTAAALAFKGFVEDNQVSHSSSWKPGPAHYYACSLRVSPISDCEAAIGDVNYKTLNEAKKVAMAAPEGSDQKIVTLKRDKILWTSAYIQNFTLVIPQGVTFTLANDDTADYNDANAKIYVQGTLDVSTNCHLTVGKNVLELYAGGRITGTGDNYGLFFVTNTKEIPVRAVKGQEDFLIDGNILSNCNITFNVESGVSLTVTGGINPDQTGFTVTNSGAGQMAVEGNVGGMYTVTPEKTLDVGAIAFNTDYLVVSYGGTITNTDSTNDRNGSKCQMNNLVMSADTQLKGYSFGVIKKGYAGTVVDLGGKTLTLDLIGGGNWTTRNFYLANTVIKNGGAFVVKTGDLVLIQNSTMNAGVLRVLPGGVLNPNGKTFTIANLQNEGGAISSSGSLVITESLAGANTISTLTLNDATMIRLSGAEQLKVTSSLTVNGRLTVNLRDYQALDQAIMELPTDAVAQTVVSNAEVISPSIRPGTRLVARDNKVFLDSDPMTLYWAAWRGTFWEHIGQTDVNGNHGLMRDEAGNLNVAHRPNDTVVFDKKHYTVDGDYLTTDYWHYDENLYIKNEVQPGTSNDWDLKILEGVTLKMGLRGSRADGQNVINALKIFVDAGSTLELGYWGNTHHYQGVIRDDVVFGGAGTILFGADLGPSLRAEGDILVKADEAVPTMDLNGKELVLNGANATIGVNLTGFGSLTPNAAGIHLKGNVNFGSAATIDASNAANMLTLDKSATFGSNLTVKLTSAQVDALPIQVFALGSSATVNMETTDVRVLVDGKPVAAFYELYRNDSDGNLYVRVKETSVSYSASVSAGYDFAGGIVTVTMDPAIADLPVTVVVKNAQGETVMHDGVEAWTGSMAVTAPVAGDAAERSETAAGRDGTVSGSAAVMVGDEDHLLAAGNYTYTVSVGDEEFSGSFYVGNKWFETKPGAEPIGGEWATAPAVTAGKYQLTDTATFSVAQDKAEGELGVIEQVVTFESPVDDAALAEAASALEDAKGALTLAELGGAAGEDAPRYGWKGLVEGVWVELTGAEATLGTHTIRVEYDRTARGPRMRYLIGATGASPLRGEGTDTEGWFALRRGGALASSAEESSSDSFALESVSYVGSGALSQLEGFVDDPALVEYAGVKYKSMEAAVAAWKATGSPSDRAITLLTNIFFAPEPGTYEIAKNGHALYLTNDMIIEREEGTTVVVGFPPVVDRYTNGLTVTLDGETIAAPFIIDGEWLGKAIPWKRHSLIQKALGEKPSGSSFKRWQAYVLGFAADAVETAKAYVRAEQNAKQDKVTLDDGLKIKDARETGVVVTRKLVGSVTAPAREDTGGTMSAVETAYDDETGLPGFDLTKMGEKVQYLKISYEFSGDAGQEK